MNFHVLTLFPEMVKSALSGSILGRAAANGLISVETVNIRDYTEDKHKKADDYPYGGGAGLLMLAQPVVDAHRHVMQNLGGKQVRTVYLTPQGKPFCQRMAREFAKEEELILLCGHYEGIDERALEEVVTDYVSIGDFVLTGGELPAMVLIDAVSRLVPGVLHNDESASEESFFGSLLEYPQYTRPEIFHQKGVPEVLLSGDHKKIRQWRRQMAEERTRKYRPDLYANYLALQDCEKRLKGDKLHHMGMLALIERGQARLVWMDDTGILLEDEKSGAYMLTTRNKEAGEQILKQVFSEKEANVPTCFVTHQEFMRKIVEERFHLKQVKEGCLQMVYTRKEALPAVKADIRRLNMADLPTVTVHYDLLSEKECAERIENGAMYGIYVDDILAGFVGEHEEGSMGMLEVFPAYRGRGLAKALETDLINRTLKRGYTPFCQVFPDNEASVSLQNVLGLYQAKEKIWWFTREK